MSQVYSTRFIASPAPDFPPPPYEVPGGFIAVIRSIEIFAAPSQDGYNALVQLVEPAVVLFSWDPTVGGSTFHWDGRQVLEAGEELTINSTLSAPSSMIVSGYLLTLP